MVRLDQMFIEDAVCHSPQKGAFSCYFRQVFRNHRFLCSHYREVKQEKKKIIMLGNILYYIYF